MSKFITSNVLRHLAAQIGVAVLMAGVAALTKVDYSSLGAYAPAAQMAAAMIVSIVNEVLGTAPKA